MSWIITRGGCFPSILKAVRFRSIRFRTVSFYLGVRMIQLFATR